MMHARFILRPLLFIFPLILSYVPLPQVSSWNSLVPSTETSKTASGQFGKGSVPFVKTWLYLKCFMPSAITVSLSNGSPPHQDPSKRPCSSLAFFSLVNHSESLSSV